MGYFTTFTTERQNAGTVRVTWTGVADTTYYVYLNGVLAERENSTPTAKSVDISWPLNLMGEITIADEEGTYSYPEESRPTIYWQAVSGADGYNIYARLAGAASYALLERLADTENASGTGTYRSWRMATPLDEDGYEWWDIAIKAYTSVGDEDVESTASAFYFPVVHLPEVPSSIAVADVAGDVKVTITD